MNNWFKFYFVFILISYVKGGLFDFLKRNKRNDVEDADLAWGYWNAPVTMGVFINDNFRSEYGVEAPSKRTDTPLHPMGSGSGSGEESYLFSDSSKRNKIPKVKLIDSIKSLKSKIEEKRNKTDSMKISELTAQAAKVEIQGEDHEDTKRTISITCQGEKEWLQCPQYHLIKINSAFWGRDDSTTCSRSGIALKRNTNKMCAQDESNTMIKVQNACDGENACELVASEIYFDRTDCPDIYKYLRLNWECAHSESRIKDSIEADLKKSKV
ncbi:uncharacterized protein LOC100210142 [Hydra vulgaris]|uniref:uncharacterized protein LOC100210142 n=1 Tax=Hydra vulgaris TaxID=6087 RepID=UPI000192574F|nr:uncharacterized protein LOC100210142 [Hydra vulgaris]XP_047143642.1 uncharacterized protein LOC100210142 [Hydra vulgaris]